MRLRPLTFAASCAALSLSCNALAQEAPAVSEAALRAHLSFLADDLLEGRGTGQHGGALTVRYLETQAAAIGLKPMKDGAYRQKVAIEGTRLLPGSGVVFTAGGKRIAPKVGEGPAADKRRCRSTRRWSSSATAWMRRKKNGTTTRASTSRARSWS
jgi:hypothetical protein